MCVCRPEDFDELEWPVRDARQFGEESCTGYATIAFENVECNTGALIEMYPLGCRQKTSMIVYVFFYPSTTFRLAMKRRVTVRNTTGIPCRVKSSIAHHSQNGKHIQPSRVHTSIWDKKKIKPLTRLIQMAHRPNTSNT